jgi:hypothetical protein
MREHPEPRPRDHADAAQDIARDLAEIASHIGQLKGDAHASLHDPNYDTLKHRLESASPGDVMISVPLKKLTGEVSGGCRSW